MSPSGTLQHNNHDRVKNSEGQMCYQSRSPTMDIGSYRRTRVDSPVHEWHSPSHQYEGIGPGNRVSSGRHEGYSEGRIGSPDVQDMWERFQALQSGTANAPVDIDLDKLTDLLENPVQHMVRQRQQGSVFEQAGDYREKDRSPQRVKVNQSRKEVTEGQTKPSEADRGQRNHAEEKRGERGTSQGQRSSGGHRRRGDDEDDDRRGNRDEDRRMQLFNYADVTDEGSEETHPDETEEGGSQWSGDGEPQKRKMAWVIKDEELHSIPENSTLDSISSDFTTSSEVDSDGKIVTKTTKRNLPGDPKLLRLQQKITKQKEKYKRELSRERKRKEKISKLEALFKEQKAATKKGMARDTEKTADSSVVTTTTSKTTSTPCSERHRHNDTTLGVSNITSTSTLTQGTVVSEDLTLVTSEISGELEKSRVKDVELRDSDNSGSVCHCCHKRKGSSRSVSPPKHPTVRRGKGHSHSTSPARRQERSRERKIPKEPSELNLREVDYNKVEVGGKTSERPSRKAVYLEIDKPQPNGVPKTKRSNKSSLSPSKRKEKENNENIKRRHHHEEQGEESRSKGHWSRSSTRRQRELEPERTDMGIQVGF